MLDGLRYRANLIANQKMCCCNITTPTHIANYQPIATSTNVPKPT
jgi:hypothetical protein